MCKVSKVTAWTSIIPLALLFLGCAHAADKSESDVANSLRVDGVPLSKVIDAVASRTQKRYLIDPRVIGNVAKEGLDLNKTSYRELQAILRLHGFAAVEIGGAVNIVPEGSVRSMPLPVIDKDATNIGEDDLFVKVVNTGKLPAAQIVPLLRPMLPQFAHLAALPDANSLVIVARYANIKTIEAVVRSLERQPLVRAGVAASVDPKPAD